MKEDISAFRKRHPKKLTPEQKAELNALIKRHNEHHEEVKKA